MFWFLIFFSILILLKLIKMGFVVDLFELKKWLYYRIYFISGQWYYLCINVLFFLKQVFVLRVQIIKVFILISLFGFLFDFEISLY